MPFAKGQSGNPNGRRKENKELQELAKKYTVEALDRLSYWMRSEEPKASVAATKEILDRGYGKPAQMITGDPEQPITHTHQLTSSDQDIINRYLQQKEKS